LKILLIIFLFVSNIFANNNIDIDQLIKSIKQAPIDQRYKKMNALKRLLKSKNRTFRKDVLIKLKSSIDTKRDLPTKNIIKIEPPKIEKNEINEFKDKNNFDRIPPPSDIDIKHIDIQPKEKIDFKHPKK
jgi:hypothetical protein